jgi:hypothetical protein
MTEELRHAIYSCCDSGFWSGASNCQKERRQMIRMARSRLLFRHLSVSATLLVAAISASGPACADVEHVLKCRSPDSRFVFSITINFDNKVIQYGSNSYFQILKVSEKSITGILTNPRLTNGEQILVLNRETGDFMKADISLHCASAKNCQDQIGPNIDIDRGNCRPPIL